MSEYKTKYFTYTSFDEEQMGATPAVFGPYRKLKGIFRIMDGKLCRVLKGSPPWLTKKKGRDMGL